MDLDEDGALFPIPSATLDLSLEIDRETKELVLKEGGIDIARVLLPRPQLFMSSDGSLVLDYLGGSEVINIKRELSFTPNSRMTEVYDMGSDIHVSNQDGSYFTFPRCDCDKW